MKENNQTDLTLTLDSISRIKVLDEDTKNRIIACVNAMQGIEDPYELVSSVYGLKTKLEESENNSFQEKKIKDLTEQNNELLRVVSVFCHKNGYKNADEMREGLNDYMEELVNRIKR